MLSAPLERLLTALPIALLLIALAPACQCDSGPAAPPQVCTGDSCPCVQDEDCPQGAVCRFSMCFAGANSGNNADNDADSDADAAGDTGDATDADDADNNANNTTDADPADVPDAPDTAPDVEPDEQVFVDADDADEDIDEDGFVADVDDNDADAPDAPPLCTNDGAEPNDTPEDATALVADTPRTLRLCPDDDDWFVFTALADARIELALSGAPALDAVVEVVDAQGEIISIFTPDAEGGTASATTPVTGDLRARVYSTSGAAGAYTITLRLDTCPPDRLEPNDLPVLAASLAFDALYDDLRICSGDVDWFRFAGLSPGQRVIVYATLGVGAGNLVARWYRAGDTGTIVQQFNIPPQGNAFALSTPDGGDLLLSISGSTPLRQYGLLAELDSPCATDAREPDDDLGAQANRPSSPGLYEDLSICSGDLDYLCVQLPAGQALTAAASFEHDEGDLELQLVTPAGAPLGASNTAADVERVQTINTTGGELTVCVLALATAFNPTVENTYTLDVSITGSLVCDEDALEDNDGTEDATPLRDRRDNPTAPITPGYIFSNPAGGPAISPLRGLKVCDGDPDVFRFHGLPGDTVGVQALFTQAQGDLDLQLLRAADLEPVAEATSTTDNEALTWIVEEEDDYFLFVTGDDVVNQSWSLEVILDGACFDDPAEPNDTRASATPLGAAETRRGVPLCADDEDRYALNLAAGQIVTAAVTYLGWRVDVDLELIAASGTVVARSNSSSDRDALTFTANVAGVYNLRVFPFNSDAATTYDLDVRVEDGGGACPSDRLEPNQTLAAPLLYDQRRSETGGLTLCHNDTDLYTFRLDYPQDLRVTVGVPFTTPNSLISLTSPDGDTFELPASPEGRSLRILNAQDGTWSLRVARASGGAARVDYALTLAAEPAACRDDLHEPNLNPSEATPAQGALDGLVLCAQDVDCFSVEATGQEHLRARLTYDRRQAELQLELFEPGGALAATSNNSTDAELVEIDTAEPGSWAVCVSSRRHEGPTARYDLLLDLSEGCVDLERNDTPTRARTLPPNTTLPARACGQDDWYVLHAAPGQPVALNLQADPALDGALTLALFDGAAEPVASAATAGGGATLTLDGAPGAPLLLRVTSPPATTSPYTLAARLSPSNPTCPPELEENDAPATAIPLTLNTSSAARLCDDVDLYAVALRAGDALAVEATFDPDRGQLGVDVLDAAGTSLLAAGTPWRNTLVARLQTDTDRTVLVRVRPAPRYAGPYSLTPSVRLGRLLCGADLAEPNDTSAQASPLEGPRGQRRGSLCGNDIDLFALPLQAGQLLHVDLGHTEGLSPALSVVDANGATLATGAPVTAGAPHRTVTWAAPADTTAFIRVSSPADLAYALHWRVVAPGTPCADDPREPNDQRTSAAALPAGSAFDLVACPGNEDWFRVDLAAAQSVAVTLTHDPAEGDVDVELVDGNGVRVGGSFALNAPELAVATAAAPGPIFVRVLHAGPAPVPYTLGILPFNR